LPLLALVVNAEGYREILGICDGPEAYRAVGLAIEGAV
jgi:hypothetical protein